MKFEDRIISFKPKPLMEDPDKVEELLVRKEKYVDVYLSKKDLIESHLDGIKNDLVYKKLINIGYNKK